MSVPDALEEPTYYWLFTENKIYILFEIRRISLSMHAPHDE